MFVCIMCTPTVYVHDVSRCFAHMCLSRLNMRLIIIVACTLNERIVCADQSASEGMALGNRRASSWVTTGCLPLTTSR